MLRRECIQILGSIPIIGLPQIELAKQKDIELEDIRKYLKTVSTSVKIIRFSELKWNYRYQEYIIPPISYTDYNDLLKQIKEYHEKFYRIYKYKQIKDITLIISSKYYNLLSTLSE